MISTCCSDIIPNWNDMRTKFGYNLLSEIARSFLRMKNYGDKKKWKIEKEK